MSPDEQFEDAVAHAAREGAPEFDEEEGRVFAQALNVLNDTGVPYVVAGAFAKHAYTGIWRDTKDLDVFLKPDGLKAALDALAAVGFETVVEFEHWLAKAKRNPYFLDLIFGTGHGQLQIDDTWFENAREVEVAGVRARLLPVEELIASKVYIAERYRFDGADVLHLILRREGRIDWQRVLRLLSGHRELLLWHLILFDFVYPGHRDLLPHALMTQLFDEARGNWSRQLPRKAFRGTLIDPFSFAVDIHDWGYEDRRDLE